MANSNANGYGVGVRRAEYILLDSETGFPDVSSAALVYPTDIGGGRNFSISPGEPNLIYHSDGDRVRATDSLAPTDGFSGTLTVGKQNLAVRAALTGVSERTLGEGKWMQWGTDKQGEEPRVGLLLAQQFVDLDTGQRNWRHYVVPSAQCIPAPSVMDENGTETTFSVNATPVTRSLWYETLTVVNDGATESSVAENIGVGKLQMCFAQGDGSTTAFTFDTDLPATAVEKISVFVDGTEVTTGTTEAVTGVTWDTAPASGELIAIVYES